MLENAVVVVGAENANPPPEEGAVVVVVLVAWPNGFDAGVEGWGWPKADCPNGEGDAAGAPNAGAGFCA